MMTSIEILYRGLKELLVQNGMSVQAEHRHAVRTAVDQRGEQTVNREAKRTIGFHAFTGNDYTSAFFRKRTSSAGNS